MGNWVKEEILLCFEYENVKLNEWIGWVFLWVLFGFGCFCLDGGCEKDVNCGVGGGLVFIYFYFCKSFRIGVVRGCS